MKRIKYLLGIIMLLLNINLALAKSGVVVKVENTTDSDRLIETVELAWSILAEKGLEVGQTIVLDASGNEIPSQLIKASNGEVTSLIFQCQLDAMAQTSFTIKKGKPANYPSKAYGKMESSRFNDFAWENDVIAFRIYHSDLMPIDGPSGGIDIWAKRTNELIVDKWYKEGDYHNDHGQGCDSYKVGPTLGAGGLSLIEDGNMNKHANYTDANIIANGPIRLIVEFSFNPQSIQGQKVSMSKTLTLDAGSSLNKFDVLYKSKKSELPLVTGILKRPNAGKICMDEGNGILAYWEPVNKKYGQTGLAIIMEESSTMGTLENHIVAYATATAGEAFTYYSGACWDKADHFKTLKDWKAYLQQYKQQLTTPLTITVE